MKLGILKESDNEKRVAVLPEGVKVLTDMKVSVMVEKGAGDRSLANDEAYNNSGASI